MRHCNEHKLSALQVGWPEQNTALNPKFLTAKISATALKPAPKSPPHIFGLATPLDIRRSESFLNLQGQVRSFLTFHL